MIRSFLLALLASVAMSSENPWFVKSHNTLMEIVVNELGPMLKSNEVADNDIFAVTVFSATNNLVEKLEFMIDLRDIMATTTIETDVGKISAAKYLAMKSKVIQYTKVLSESFKNARASVKTAALIVTMDKISVEMNQIISQENKRP